MASSEVRANRLMWFMAGAVVMAVYLLGPRTLVHRAYDASESFSIWFSSL
jgi:hypothetical protein